MEESEATREQRRRRAVSRALVLILPLVVSGTAVAQETVEIEVAAAGGVGLGESSRRIDHAAWGGALYGGWRLPGTRFSLGGRLTMANYGSEHNRDLAGYSAGVPPDVKYAFNLLTTHVVLRYQRQLSAFTPYLEASGGLGYFFTQVYRGNDGGTPIILGETILIIGGEGAKTLQSSLVPSLGLGGGLKVRLAAIGDRDRARRAPSSLSLSLQGRYVYCGTARYLEAGGLALDGGQLITRPQHSHTDTFFLGAGLSVEWGGPRRRTP